MDVRRCLVIHLMASLAASVPVVAQETLAVKAMRAAPQQASLYEIAFTTTDPLAADAEIRLTFPSAYDLKHFEIAGSTTILGGLSWKRDGQVVTLRRSGLGAVVPPGQKVSVQLGMIQNPSRFDTAEPLRIEVLPSPKTRTLRTFTSRVEFLSR